MELQIDMPANVDAERSVLGAVLLDSNCADEVLGTLGPDDFSLDSHRRIARAMRDMNEAREIVDLVTLAEKLSASRELTAIGGVPYLSSLTDGLPRRGSIAPHVRLVKDKSLLRQLIHAANAAITQAVEGESAKDCYESLESALLDAREGALRKSWRSYREIAPLALDTLKAAWDADKARDAIGLPTGIKPLDLATTGIRVPELWVIGARPGRGKTALMTQIAAANAQDNIKVGVFSAEMSEVQIFTRSLTQNSNLPACKVRDPRWLNVTERRIAEATIENLGSYPIMVDDSPSPSLRSLRAKASIAVRKYGCQVLMLDYIQLVQVPNARDERQQVTKVAFALRDLSRELNVGIVALSQLKRAYDGKVNKRPAMDDLMESSAIEQAAQVIVLLYMPVDEQTGAPTGADELVLAKQREGQFGSVPVRFDRSDLTFKPREQ